MKNIFNLEKEITDFFNEYEKRKKKLKFIESYKSKVSYEGKSFSIEEPVVKKKKTVKVIIHGKSRK